MSSRYQQAPRFSATGITSGSILATIVAMGISVGIELLPVQSAHAEYRCATPDRLSNAEMRACELARQDTPNALIHFVNRTKSIYNLYTDDYVSKADVDRWELANRMPASDSPAVAGTRSNTKDVSKAE
jgi:hypothetical protein